MNEDRRACWDHRHSERHVGDPEPFVIEMLPLLRGGLTLDVAAGSGRHSLLLARAGMRVHAVDFSVEAMLALRAAARSQNLPIEMIVADLECFPLPPACYDVIVNTNFLDRKLIPSLKQALKIGGVLLFDTFLIDQAEIGHPRNPEFLLKHYELRELLNGLEIVRYREGLVGYPSGSKAWRAGALALRRD